MGCDALSSCLTITVIQCCSQPKDKEMGVRGGQVRDQGQRDNKLKGSQHRELINELTGAESQQWAWTAQTHCSPSAAPSPMVTGCAFPVELAVDSMGHHESQRALAFGVSRTAPSLENMLIALGAYPEKVCTHTLVCISGFTPIP